eukprot:CCRYP_017922-RA/>CCRYP_017922-RA protein AED:0.48 eAED:1.00 QI:0/-1/0/1/-1/0/1/0/34
MRMQSTVPCSQLLDPLPLNKPHQLKIPCQKSTSS